MAFPGALPSYAGFTASHTLAADSHAAQHNQEQTDIIALANKLGTGASTPTSGLVLRGNGAGTSAWGQVILTSDVSGVLPQANGGTGTTLATGTGKAVYDTSPTIATPAMSNPTITGGGSWAGSPTLSTPTIADFTNATHDHSTNAKGGTLNGATALQAATLKAAQMFKGIVYRRQGSSATDWGGSTATGTSTFDTSAVDVMIQAGNKATTTGQNDITFPVAFSQTPIIIVTPYGSSGVFPSWYTVLQTTTGFSVQSANTNLISIQWMAIGT